MQSTHLLHGMARACMGDEIQLYGYNTNQNGYWVTTFAWSTPLEEMSYVVAIIWKQVGRTLEPDMIKYGATFVRPDKKGEIWNSNAADPIKIGESEEARSSDTPEHETMELAKMLGYERFLKTRICFPKRETLRQHLKEIADEYMEHFEAFMLMVIMSSGPLVDRSESSIAQSKKIALPMVNRLYPQLIAHNVVSVQPIAHNFVFVQPIKTPSALIYYLRYMNVQKFTILWFKTLVKKIWAKWKEETVKTIIRCRQRHPGPSWLVQASDHVETA